jgi:alpha-tubulin suppressor-like RCC1 family protein
MGDFNSPVGNLEDYFIKESWLIDQYIGGELWIWGSSNLRGVLGNNINKDISTPITTFAGGSNWKQLCSAFDHVAAIKSDGTLWVWGNNSQGQLGINNILNRSTPVTTFAGGNNWKQVSCADRRTAAIKTDGSLWIWGYNFSGELGTNNRVNYRTPVTTFAGGNNWKQVSLSGLGNLHVAAIKTDGTLWLWGWNVYGQLGNNDVTTRSTPVTTFAGGNNWKQVASGGSHTAAIKTDGTLWVWGNNYQSILGINSSTGQDYRSIPITTFAGGNDWKQVSCGAIFTSAVKTNGSLWTWGFNSWGQLGINDTRIKSTPVTTFAGGNDWKQVACGGYHIAAIKTDGTLWTWGGNNSQGKLGINQDETKVTPVTTFAGGNNWKQVSAGGVFSAALKNGEL